MVGRLALQRAHWVEETAPASHTVQNSNPSSGYTVKILFCIKILQNNKKCLVNVYHMTRRHSRKGRTTRKNRRMAGGDGEDGDNYDMNLGLLFGGIVAISLALAIARV
jgi:hypothetical protein